MGPKKPPPFKAPERFNWRIAQHFARQEHEECLTVIEQALEETAGFNEYPLHVKGLITRGRGKVQEALELFQAATALNPSNGDNLKQVGHCLYLLGKHRAALGVYKQARDMAADLRTEDKAAGGKGDWELWHNAGLCHAHLEEYDEAVEAFEKANAIGRHDQTFVELGRVWEKQGDHKKALRVYRDALDFSPENPELLTTVGLTYLRLEDHQRAFDFLGNALTHDPRNARAILAAGSIIQDNKDMDVALHKYRVAAVMDPDCPELWNNVGMALFGKGKNIAAVSCLKKALNMDPFAWIISFNLGLVHLGMELHCSAFHHFSVAANFKKDYAPAYMYMGITLAAMDDTLNAVPAFEKSLKMSDDYVTRLNFAVTLANMERFDDAARHFAAYERMVEAMGPDADHEEGLFELAGTLRDFLQDKAA